MSSYAKYCQEQATACARRARLASSPEIVAYCRRLEFRWLRLAEQAYETGWRTGSQEPSNGYIISAARQARCIPGRIRKTSGRADCPELALVAPTKANELIGSGG